MARQGLITYSEAVAKAYITRKRFAAGDPYSAVLLGYGHGRYTHYSDGIFCYVAGFEIRVLNVHTASKSEHVVDVGSLLAELEGDWAYDQQAMEELLSCLTTDRAARSSVDCACPSCLHQELGMPSLIINVHDCRHNILCFSLRTHNLQCLTTVDLRNEVPLERRALKITPFLFNITDVRPDGQYVFVVASRRKQYEQGVGNHWDLHCWNLHK